MSERIVGGGGGFSVRAADDTGGRREWKVASPGADDCREGGEEEGGLVHSGTFVKKGGAGEGGGAGGAGKWYNQEGNAMLMSEARMRRENHEQATANMTAKGGLTGHEWFSDNWHESVSCSVHAKVGGSYVCDPHRISVCGCLVYSFDDGGDGSFEDAVLKHVPHCSVHVMDNARVPNSSHPRNVILHRTARLGVEGEGGHEAPCGGKPLRVVRGLLGHRGKRLDILRVRADPSSSPLELVAPFDVLLAWHQSPARSLR